MNVRLMSRDPTTAPTGTTHLDDSSRALMHRSSRFGDPTWSQENAAMSNTTFIPATPTLPTVRRASIGLVVAASLLAFAVRASAQSTSAPPVTLRPVVGALMGTGDQHDALKSAVLVGGQASYAFQ